MKSLFVVFLLSASFLQASWVFVDGRLQNDKVAATLSCEDHYKEACSALEKEDWEEAAKHLQIIRHNFPNSAYGSESAFFLGVCLLEREDYDLANEAFSDYLATSQPKYFQQAIEYKFYMANAFQQGARRRPFTAQQLPKILPGRNLAYRLYDEVVQSVPCHELAAQSLWAKANMLWEDYEYRESVEAFQSLIRRFPKHELTPKAYLAINQVYGDEAEWEYQNPDLLQLAEINTKKFELAFPRDDRLQEARDGVLALKETYAAGLWDTGQFYEGQGYLGAAKLYYQNALEQFAGTSVAEKCRGRLLSLTNE